MLVAIIGAGMAGLAAAEMLAGAGHEVRLFDKGRGPGGRMSTRRLSSLGLPEGEWQFDHGAPWFAARDRDFLALMRDWAEQGVVARWPDPEGEHWVGVPGMNALVRHAMRHHEVEFSVQITGMVRAGKEWWLHAGGQPYGPFDAVVLAIPAEQAAVLAGLHDFSMARQAASVVSLPCWTGMFAFGQPLPAPDVLGKGAVLQMALRNGAKPRRHGETWVVHATPEWSRAHLEQEREEIAAQLLAALAQAVGRPLPKPVVAIAHRWRFACPQSGGKAGETVLWNRALQLGACGDWLRGSGVEAAWVSGRALAARMLEDH